MLLERSRAAPRSAQPACRLGAARCKIGLFNHKEWRTKIELSAAIADRMGHFYNPEPFHSLLGCVPPVEFEALHAATMQT